MVDMILDLEGLCLHPHINPFKENSSLAMHCEQNPNEHVGRPVENFAPSFQFRLFRCHFNSIVSSHLVAKLKPLSQAHVLLHIIGTSGDNQPSPSKSDQDLSAMALADLQSHIAESYKMVSALYVPFKSKAKDQVRLFSVE